MKKRMVIAGLSLLLISGCVVGKRDLSEMSQTVEATQDIHTAPELGTAVSGDYIIAGDNDDAAGSRLSRILFDGNVGNVLSGIGTWIANGSGSGDLKADGTIPMTADWPFGAFDITGGVDSTWSGQGSFGTLTSGAGGFTVDSTGDMVVKDFAPTGAVDTTGATSNNTGPLVFADTTTAPSVVGMIRYVNNVTGILNGTLALHNGSDVINYIGLYDSDLPTNDDYVVSYDAVNDKFYMKADAGAGSETNSLETVTTGIATTEIPIGTAADTVVYAALSGDVTMSNTGVVTIADIVDSIAWNAAGTNSDGTQCADPAEVTINSGPITYSTICTDNDGSTIHGHVIMPDSWNAGTVTMTSEYIQTAADTAVLNGDIACMCRGAGETVNNTWGTEVALDDAAVTGSNGVDQIDSAAMTCSGTCAGGDTLFWRYQLDATGTTTAVATLNFTGWKMEYTYTVGD